MECQPGEELQLDFGLGAPIRDGPGKKRRSWVLRSVLSYSRKGYSEAVTRQPEMRDEITSIQWLGFALTEACFFYGLVAGLISYVLK